MKKTYNAPDVDVLRFTASDEVLTTPNMSYNEEVDVWE